MNQKKITIPTCVSVLLLAFCFVGASNANTTSVPETLDWLIQTFEENDAGAKVAIEKMGRENYEANNARFRERAQSIMGKSECAQLLRDWMSAMRKGHLYLSELNGGNGIFQEPTSQEIEARYAEWERFDCSEVQARQRIDSMTGVPDRLIGIWQADNLRIAILPDDDSLDRDFVGVVLQSGSPYWSEGQLKMEICRFGQNLMGTAYRSDRVTYKIKNAYLVGDQYFVQNNVRWERLYPECPQSSKTTEFIDLMDSDEPFLINVWDETLLLRMPSFDASNKVKIDQILSSNQSLILRTKNLIIDIRNNGGGSDWTWNNVMPFLATTAVRVPNNMFLSTPLNRATLINTIARSTDAQTRGFWKNTLELMEEKGDGFVSEHEEEVFVFDTPKASAFPKNVALLVDENVASAAEALVWVAKQSHKTKVYGIPTAGMLDASNIVSTDSPTGDFRLYYSISLNRSVTEYAIDEYGFQPDFYLDPSIPREKWIDFVVESLATQK